MGKGNGRGMRSSSAMLKTLCGSCRPLEVGWGLQFCLAHVLCSGDYYMIYAPTQYFWGGAMYKKANLDTCKAFFFFLNEENTATPNLSQTLQIFLNGK